MDKKDSWRYYNHALMPILPPYEKVDLTAFKDKNFWKNWNGFPLLARWVSNWDCGCKTNWWYTVKDTPLI